MSNAERKRKAKTTPPFLTSPEQTFLLDSLFELSPLGLCIVDERFRYVKVSKYLATAINGRSVEEHVGKTVPQIMGRKSWTRVKPYYQRALAGAYIHDVLVTGEDTKNPSLLRQFLVSIYPLPATATGKLIGVIVQEITDQVAAEQELLSYQHRLQIAQAAGGVGVFEWDFETNQIWSSPEGRQLFELSLETEKGEQEHWLNKIHPEDKTRVLDLIQHCSEEQLPFDCEYRILTNTQGVKWIRGKGKFFYNQAGEATKLFGVNYDITKRKKQEHFLKFKAEVSRLLMSPLSHKVAFQQICSLAVRYVADWCSIDLLEGDTFVLAAVSHRDPQKVTYAKNLRQRYPMTLANNPAVAAVIRTKQPLVLPQIRLEPCLTANLDQDQREILHQLQLNSAIVVPLVVLGEVIGVITLVLAESKGNYDEDDLEITEQLALRTSLYLENTKLYQTIESERQRLEQLVANVPGIVYESQLLPDGTQRITSINAYAEQFLGYPLSDWTTGDLTTLGIVHPDDVALLKAETALAIKDRRTGTGRFQVRKKDGSYVWVETRFTPVYDQHNQVVTVRGVTTDISERMALEQRKDDFIATASHELKTPLTSLKVFTEVLRQSPELQQQPKVLRYLQRMQLEIDRLTQLVYDLLDLSRIQRGQLPLRRQTTNLNQLITEVVQSLQPTFKHQIVVQFAAPLTVSVDKHRFTQVLTNLLTNATKYSPDADRVVVFTKLDQDAAIIGVQDFGIGIAEQYLPLIFQRFFRVFDERDRTFPGLGMGLFIAKNIVEKHGGQL